MVLVQHNFGRAREQKVGKRHKTCLLTCVPLVIATDHDFEPTAVARREALTDPGRVLSETGTKPSGALARRGRLRQLGAR